MADVRYDRREQYQQIMAGLLPGENVLAVYDAVGVGTGFIGLTDRRVILQDKSFMGKKLAITSIPYGKVTAVSLVSDKSFAATSSAPGRSRSTSGRTRTRSRCAESTRPSTSTT
jgi:hypothetical protein